MEYRNVDTESIQHHQGGDQATIPSQFASIKLRHNRVEKLKSIHSLHSSNDKKDDNPNHDEGKYIMIMIIMIKQS